MSHEILNDLPIGQYHKLERLSPSGIAALLRSPAHYRAQRKAWGEQEPSKALRIGQAVHIMTLEPEKEASHVPVAPVVNKRTKVGKAEWEAWCDDLHEDAVVLDRNERWVARSAADAILNHRGLQRSELLTGIPERTIIWNEHGVPAKARPDMIAERGFWPDIKTTEDASDFARSAAKYGYARQAAWLQMAAAAAGLECHGVVFVVVEKSPPFGVRIVQFDSTALIQGEREIFRALDTYRRCLEADAWPSYDIQLETISLPLWAVDPEQ